MQSPHFVNQCVLAHLFRTLFFLSGKAMMEILRNHEGGICMHGGFETTAAMVSELHQGRGTHWLTGDHDVVKPSFFEFVWLCSAIPVIHYAHLYTFFNF